MTAYLSSSRDAWAYAALYALENYLRFVVRWELRASNPTDWEGVLNSDVVKSANERSRQERELGYLDGRDSALLSYLNLSELKDVILGPLWHGQIKDNWGHQECVRADFKKLIAVRNKVAHFRPVTSRDLRIVESFGRDLIDWTRYYSHIAARTTVVTGQVLNPDDVKVFRKSPLLISNWNACISCAARGGVSFRICRVANYFRIDILKDDFSVAPESFTSFIEKYESVVAFAAVSSLGQKVAFYIPVSLEICSWGGLFRDFVAVSIEHRQGLSSEDVSQQFCLDRREGALIWEEDAPFGFRLPERDY